MALITNLLFPLPAPGTTASSGLHGHAQAHHAREGSSGRLIIRTQRPLSDNAQPSQETGIHASSWIRTSRPSSGEAADSRLRKHGHWDRHRSYSLESEYNDVSTDCFNLLNAELNPTCHLLTLL